MGYLKLSFRIILVLSIIGFKIIRFLLEFTLGFLGFVFGMVGFGFMMEEME